MGFNQAYYLVDFLVHLNGGLDLGHAKLDVVKVVDLDTKLTFFDNFPCGV